LKKLNLGCGSKVEDGAINVDKYYADGIDVVHDLDVMPYPFESESFDEVILDNVLEHLEKPIDVMNEVYRVLKKGGKAKVIVPYFRSLWAYIDPTHKNWFTVHSFDYIVKGKEESSRYKYTDKLFDYSVVKFNDEISTAKIKLPFLILGNKFPRFYELYLSRLIPLDQLTYELRKG